ncbi:MAG: sigma-70 family RNA polymerase sigma factor [Gaiellaceae bacterium]
MSATLTSTTTQRLTASESEALWRNWKERRDSRSRDQLVLAYAPMVRYIASRKVRELPAHCDVDDLSSAGLVALMEAIDRFDPAKGASFEQYAWTRVAGALVDELRKQDWASRSVRREGRRIERARDSFFARNGTTPTEAELAAELGTTVEALRATLEDIERSDVGSLNAPARGADDAMLVEVGETIQAPDGEHEPESTLLGADRNAAVRAAIARLSDRERHVLALVHVQELQGAEIGRMLGISESRVSQILSGIRSKLKHQLVAYETAA